jgi:uncharacterized protein with HEPN domain
MLELPGTYGSPDATTASVAYDAVLRNLAVIGEAAKSLPET